MILRSPLDAQIEVTNRCNHRCLPCYNTFIHSPVFMISDEIKRIINELHKNDVFSYIFTGGEPLLNKKVLLEGIELTNERGRDSYVNSNLSIPLTNEDIKVLKTTKNILFSFPSYKEDIFKKYTQSESYKEVLRNIERLSLEGVTLTANQVVTDFNKDHIYETAKFLKDNFDIINFCATPVNPSGMDRNQLKLKKEDYHLIFESLKDIRNQLDMNIEVLTCIPQCLLNGEFDFLNKGCSAGKSTIAISSKGFVRKCVESQKEFGNILNEPLEEIWKRITSDKKPEYELCGGCVEKETCSFGCEVRANKNNGIDYLINNSPLTKKKEIKRSKLEENKIYSLKKSFSRKERDENHIVTDGSSYLIEGNESFVNFYKSLEGITFTTETIYKKFGEIGLGLIKYLNEKGAVLEHEEIKTK